MRIHMLSSKFVSLPLKDLINACTPPEMKRMPKGVKGEVAKTTIIEFHPDFTIIDSTAQSKAFSQRIGIRKTVTVGNLHMHATLLKFPRVEQVELGCKADGQTLILKCQALEIKIVGEK